MDDDLEILEFYFGKEYVQDELNTLGLFDKSDISYEEIIDLECCFELEEDDDWEFQINFDGNISCYNRKLIDFNPSGKNILMVDDDDFVILDYKRAIEFNNNKIWTVKTPEEFVSFIELNSIYLDIIIVDIRMYHGEMLSSYETRVGYSTGVELAKIARDFSSDSIIIALTLSDDTIDKLWFENNYSCYFCNKRDYPPDKFALFLKTLSMKESPKLQSFIVHGHDLGTLFELKNYLQNRLNWPEPIILMEKASKGRTVIEKFEDFSEKIDVVFALFTPDDFKVSDIARARQNVIFEFGYFLGKLGRKSGRVFMLYKDRIEIPSDLSGVIYIDISNGIESIGEIIRKEIESIWL